MGDHSRFRLLRTLAMGLLASFLGWQIVTRSFVAYLAEVAPDAAVQLRPDDPVALLNLAEDFLTLSQAEQSTQSDRTETRPAPGEAVRPLPTPRHAAVAERMPRFMSERALRGDPLNSRGLRMLGQIADAEADEPQALRFMQAAARRSLGESTALYWLMRRSYSDNDFVPAAYYADVLLRTRPQAMTYLMPALVKMAERKDAAGAIKTLLATNPPWRPKFFEALPRSISDARTPLDLLLGLKDTPTPPTAAELDGYLTFLVERKLYEIAYYTWLQLLPQDRLGHLGLLYNGSFEAAPSGLPFDWIIPAGPGVTADLVARPDETGKRALVIGFGYGRVDFRPIRQLIMLPPGHYNFKGTHRGELIGRRGPLWRVACAGETQPALGQSPMLVGNVPVWTAFDFHFTVPERDCRAQDVTLVLDARSASETIVSGAIMYSELRITRADMTGATPK